MDPELEETISASPIDTVRGPFGVLRLEPRSATVPGAVCMFWDDTETTAIVPWSSRQHETGIDRGNARQQGPFGMLRLRVARPFVARGFLAAATTALAEAGINVFIVSTFSFDFVLVRAELLSEAMTALGARGFPVGEVTDAW